MIGRLALLVASIVLCVTAAARCQEVSVTEVYLRKRIENLAPSRERATLIAFLDRCRAASDKFVRAVISGSTENARGLLVGDVRAEMTAAQFGEVLSAMNALYGAISGVEYRNQAIEKLPRGTGRDEAFSTVWYAANTSPPTTAKPFAIVKAMDDGAECLIVRYELLSYGENIPPWIAEPQDGIRR